MFQSYKGLPREIYILFIARMVNAMGRFIGPLLTLILTTKIGMSTAEVGSLISLSVFLQAPCVLYGGHLADLVGRKKTITLFLGISSVSYIICAFLPMNSLLANTLIAASCFASFASAPFDAIVMDYTDEENRQASYSLLYMGMNVGAAIAGVIGGFMLENHVKLLFVADGITTFIMVLLIVCFIKEKWAVKEVLEHDEKEKEAIKESVGKVLLKHPMLVMFAIIIIVYNFVYEQFSFGIPIGMNENFGEKGSGYFGIVSSLNAIVVVVFTPWLVHITKKMKVQHILGVGGFCYAACFFLLSISSHMTGYVVGILLLTAGEILCTVNTAIFIANNSPTSHLGRISSVISIISGTGVVLSPLVIGKVLNYFSINQTFQIVGVIAIAGALLMYQLHSEKHSVEEAVQNEM